jgi:hypothetical protein
MDTGLLRRIQPKNRRELFLRNFFLFSGKIIPRSGLPLRPRVALPGRETLAR